MRIAHVLLPVLMSIVLCVLVSGCRGGGSPDPTESLNIQLQGTHWTYQRPDGEVIGTITFRPDHSLIASWHNNGGMWAATGPDTVSLLYWSSNRTVVKWSVHDDGTLRTPGGSSLVPAAAGSPRPASPTEQPPTAEVEHLPAVEDEHPPAGPDERDPGVEDERPAATEDERQPAMEDERPVVEEAATVEDADE